MMSWRGFIRNEGELSEVWDKNGASVDVLLSGGVKGFSASYDVSGVPGERDVYIYSEGDYLPSVSVIVRGVGAIPEEGSREYLSKVCKGFIAKYIVPWVADRYDGEGVADELGGVDVSGLSEKFRTAFGADIGYEKYVDGCTIEPCEFDEGRAVQVY